MLNVRLSKAHHHRRFSGRISHLTHQLLRALVSPSGTLELMLPYSHLTQCTKRCGFVAAILDVMEDTLRLRSRFRRLAEQALSGENRSDDQHCESCLFAVTNTLPVRHLSTCQTQRSLTVSLCNGGIHHDAKGLSCAFVASPCLQHGRSPVHCLVAVANFQVEFSQRALDAHLARHITMFPVDLQKFGSNVDGSCEVIHSNAGCNHSFLQPSLSRGEPQQRFSYRLHRNLWISMGNGSLRIGGEQTGFQRIVGAPDQLHSLPCLDQRSIILFLKVTTGTPLQLQCHFTGHAELAIHIPRLQCSFLG
mmetsp:Transcript_4067/g.11426  ORF Transcript_4067/g.11426 Transcript_4067/m.11426 type:complete len:306 (-) Transcript_4067:624-1541(-)